ncbi:Nn.00g060960.m01.CDS01 [Neocucurbitaria sp. VM-36]
MAFITSRRAELRFKITTNSARLRQFLLGMGVKSISNIEGKIEAVSSQLPLLKPGLETHFLSRQGLRKKLEEIRADILTGRRDLPAADSVDSAVDIEDEVLGDNLTDVDLWYEVHAWMDTLPSNASAKTQQREDLTNPPQQEHNNRSIIDTRYLKRVPAPNIDTTYHLNPPTKTWLPVSQVPAPPSPSTETIIPSTVPLPVPPEELHTNPTLHLTTKRGRTPRPKNRPPFPSANTSS